MSADADEKAEKKKPPVNLLDAVRAEMKNAVSFDTDADLRSSSERALLYLKGDMSKDVPSLPNRSSVVSSDLSDAVENVKADLMEIFTGGDDVVSFSPTKLEDEDAARQETTYLHHVAFQENEGFLQFHTAIEDALLLKLAIFTWDWQTDIREQEEKFTGKNAVEMQLAGQEGEITDVVPDEDGQTYSFTLMRKQDYSCAKYWAVPPDDFGWAQDATKVIDGTYFFFRARPRAQELIAQGFDRKKVDQLPVYSAANQEVDQARDNAGESTAASSGGSNEADDLRVVETKTHFIRVLGDDNKLETWKVVTDAEAKIELDSEEVNRIPFAVGSPYLIAHRLCGRSLSDLLFEVQKIKTALYRMLLDSGYFALNQRVVVDMNKANEFTLSDLMMPQPGMPVRVKGDGAISPLNSGGVNFDIASAIEFFSTVAEQKTGVVRNAQGLNPDTLHDTASGAMMLLSNAQKRVRMIARCLAETVIKPLFLGLHATIRENDRAEHIVSLTGTWVPINPSTWAERNAMTVEVGLGAAGKDMEIASMGQLEETIAKLVEAQGGSTDGPIVTKQNLFKFASDKARKLGVKAPQEYFSDPSKAPPQPPQPNPEVVKAQAEAAQKQQEHQDNMALAQSKQAGELQLAHEKAAAELAVDQRRNELEHEREQARQANNMALEQMKLASEERIAIETAHIRARAQIEAARIAAKASTGEPAEREEAAAEVTA